MKGVSNLKLKPIESDFEADSHGKIKCCCVECGKEVTEKNTDFFPIYCNACKPIKNLKENWKPLGAGTVSRIFIIK